MTCGAESRCPAGELVGLRLAGGPPNPAALARPAAAAGGAAAGARAVDGATTRGKARRDGGPSSARPA